jgi:hypothetical protein
MASCTEKQLSSSFMQELYLILAIYAIPIQKASNSSTADMEITSYCQKKRALRTFELLFAVLQGMALSTIL